MPISPSGIKQSTNQQLLDDHRIMHAWWVSVTKNKKKIEDQKTGKPWNVENIFNMHKLIVEEMKKRGLNHHIVDPGLDKMKLPSKLEDMLSKLSTVVIIKDYISLVGSNADGRPNPEDIDLVVKQKSRSQQLEETFLGACSPDELNQFHIVYNTEGASGRFIPLFDLVLVRKKSLDLPERPHYFYPMFGPAPAELDQKSQLSSIFLHRLEDEVKFLTRDGLEIEGFEDLKKQALDIQKPKEFILEGTICSDGNFRVVDIWRWASTELIFNSQGQRIFFLEKIQRELPNFVWVFNDADLEFEISVSPGKPFQSLKARSGYGLYEFNNPMKLWEFWAKGDRITKGIAVEKKFDGFSLQIHKIDSDIKIFTEDKKRDISSNLPMIVEEAKKLPFNEVVINSEMVWYKDNKPIPRHKMMAIIAGKKALTGEDIRAHVHDALYFKDKDLHTELWTERQKALKQILPKDTDHLKRVIPIIAYSEKELITAITAQAKLEGSEGAMCKVIDSIYPLSGRTPAWSKIKMVKSIRLRVIGKRIKKATGGGESKTFSYRGAFLKDGKLEAMNANSQFSPKDMDEENDWKMGLGFKNGEAGMLKYAETYTTNIDARIGDTITVTPIAINAFKDKEGITRFAFMFPRVANVTPGKPDDLATVQRIAGTKEAIHEDPIDSVLMNLRNEDFPITLEVS